MEKVNSPKPAGLSLHQSKYSWHNVLQRGGTEVERSAENHLMLSDPEMASYLCPSLKAFKMFPVLATRLFNCAAAHATLHRHRSDYKYVPLIIKELFNCPG